MQISLKSYIVEHQPFKEEGCWVSQSQIFKFGMLPIPNLKIADKSTNQNLIIADRFAVRWTLRFLKNVL